MTTDIAFAPALPSRNASQSSSWATMIAEYGARDLDVTSRGLALVRGGNTDGGVVLNTLSTAGNDTAALTK